MLFRPRLFRAPCTAKLGEIVAIDQPSISWSILALEYGRRNRDLAFCLFQHSATLNQEVLDLVLRT